MASVRAAGLDLTAEADTTAARNSEAADPDQWVDRSEVAAQDRVGKSGTGSAVSGRPVDREAVAGRGREVAVPDILIGNRVLEVPSSFRVSSNREQGSAFRALVWATLVPDREGPLVRRHSRGTAAGSGPAADVLGESVPAASGSDLDAVEACRPVAVDSGESSSWIAPKWFLAVSHVVQTCARRQARACRPARRSRLR